MRLTVGSRFQAAIRIHVNLDASALAEPRSSGWAGKIKGETVMRSDLVFGALSQVTNRYQLCQLASKATRKLHKPNTRLQDTTNEVLVRFHSTNPGGLAPVAATIAQQPVERRRAA
jgi:hypothetical protein